MLPASPQCTQQQHADLKAAQQPATQLIHAVAAGTNDCWSCLSACLQDDKKRIAIIGADIAEDEFDSAVDEQNPKQLSTTEAAGALPPPGASTATQGAGTGLAEALNLAPKPPSSSSSSSVTAASADLPTDDATDPELASWVEQLQQEVRGLGALCTPQPRQSARIVPSLHRRVLIWLCFGCCFDGESSSCTSTATGCSCKSL